MSVTESQRADEPRSGLRRILAAATAVELAIGGISLVTIFVFVLLQAIQRYSPLERIAWTGELSRFALVWLTFSAIGVLVTRRGHIALEVVDTLRNPILVRIVQVFALAVVTATGVGLAIEAAALIATQGILRSPVLRLPMSWVYVLVLLGAVSLTLRSAVAAIDVALHGPVLRQPEAAGDEGGVV